jgi:TPP-dependent trihydroxycyclohexane-1,2-dione (THcHDO) dehydratase
MISLEDSPIEFILTRHEQGAAFMAEVHGRLTGEPGVCLGTLGPGATNLITGVADGNMDRAPLVCITGQADVERQHKESHQHMDVVAMMRPVTKWAHSVIHPDNIPEVVRKAFKIAATEKPGACHIELPEDIAERDAATAPIEPERLRRPVPDDKIVDRVFECIRSASRPVILAGNGTIRKRASKQLRRFVETSWPRGAWIATTSAVSSPSGCRRRITSRRSSTPRTSSSPSATTWSSTIRDSGIRAATSASCTSTSSPRRWTRTTGSRSRWSATSPTPSGC